MNRFFVITLLASSLLACEKQEVASPMLNEYILGDWEVRESIDFINFRDYEYHDIGPPYIAFYRFKEDQTLEIWVQDFPYDPVPFEVNLKDSVLIIDQVPWNLHSFNESFLDIRVIGGHGLQGHRLYKLD